MHTGLSLDTTTTHSTAQTYEAARQQTLL